jgi:hypothetical protein
LQTKLHRILLAANSEGKRPPSARRISRPRSA